MRKVAIIGAGILGNHMAHYINQSAELRVVGFYDDFQPKGELQNELPVLGTIEEIKAGFEKGEFDSLMIGIGYNHMVFRQELFKKFLPEIPFETFIHASCFTDVSVKIGAGVFALPGCVFDKGVEIGNNVFFNIGCLMAHDSIIRDNCFFGSGVNLGGFAAIGPDCFAGINSTLINNVNVARHVNLASGTVVIKNLEEPGWYAGVPARKIK